MPALLLALAPALLAAGLLLLALEPAPLSLLQQQTQKPPVSAAEVSGEFARAKEWPLETRFTRTTDTLVQGRRLSDDDGGSCPRTTNSECSWSYKCRKDYGGTAECTGFPSWKWKCTCKAGYCFFNGACREDDFLASVAPVNQDHPTFPAPHNKVNTALAFSGGGARALVFAMGAYRALEDLGLMQHVDGISSVSGGTWASSVYMFADMGKDELLGAPTSPEQLSPKSLGETPAAMGAAITQSSWEFVRRVLRGGIKPRRVWQEYVADIVLKPFGLNDREKFLAGSAEQLERIRRENPRLADQPFLVPTPGRPPVFVMGGTALSPVGYQSGSGKAVSLQMSPDFSGSPFWPGGRPRSMSYKVKEFSSGSPARPLDNVTVGGGLVETFAFGGSAPKGKGQRGGEGKQMDPPKRPFTLADAVGISSNALAGVFANYGVTVAVPRVSFWPVLPTSGPQNQDAMEFEVGDGGSLENSGLLAMLQRGAKQVSMWVSTYIPLSSEIDFCAPIPADLDLERVFAGEGPDKKADGFAVAPMVSDKFGYSYLNTSQALYYTHNQVFAKEDLPPLLCELQKLKRAGKPTVYSGSFTVKPNQWWGIQGGYTVKLLVVYLEQCRDFEKALPKETQEALGPDDAADRTSGNFARFPRYATTWQTGTDFINLTPSQVNLLAAQSEYFVRQNENLFREAEEGVALEVSWNGQQFARYASLIRFVEDRRLRARMQGRAR